MDKKICLKYYFSVEGQTEKWYLEWLQKQINDNDKANCKVKFDIQVQKNPIKRVKSLNVLSKYLSVLNACFNEKFETMAQYKEEENFKKVLDKLTLNDVYYAIQNAEKITKYNQENQIKFHFAKYTYYRNNPSLNLHEHIRKILEDTGLI